MYVFSAKGAVIIPAWGNAPGADRKSDPGLKAHSILPQAPSISPLTRDAERMNRAVGAQ
jgi:hypothetical protein